MDKNRYHSSDSTHSIVFYYARREGGEIKGKGKGKGESSLRIYVFIYIISHQIDSISRSKV